MIEADAAGGVADVAARLPASPTLWASFAFIVTAIIVFDLFWMGNARPRIRACCALALSYAVLAGVFGLWLTFTYGVKPGALFATSYLVEVSLSIDNLLVIALVFAHFGVPQHLQRRVLFWGVLGAIIMRGVMIGAGAIAISHFEWLLGIFSLLLLFTGARILMAKDEVESVPSAGVTRFATRFLRVDPELSDERFFVRRSYLDGPARLYATPLFLALIVIEVADLIFAIDSIPAALAISTDPLIVFTSNIFAIVGLRAMYFAVAGGLQQLVFLRHALGVLLMFIGAKIGYEQLGGHVDATLSLIVTIVLITGGVVLSRWHGARETRNAPAE